MRFLILLVASAMAADKCVTVSADVNPTTGCLTAKTGGTKTVACTKDNCEWDILNQWVGTTAGLNAAWSAADETERLRCASNAVTATECAPCKDFLMCSGDVQAAKAAADAKVPAPSPPTTCKAILDAAVATGTAVPSCKANAAWAAGNTPGVCAATPGTPGDWTKTVKTAFTKYGPAGTTCTGAIFKKCDDRFGCDDFTWAGKYVAPTTTTKEPAGTCADKDKKAQTALKTKKDCEAVTGNVWTVTKADTKKSPAAMISAGIALIALLF